MYYTRYGIVSGGLILFGPGVFSDGESDIRLAQVGIRKYVYNNG